MGSSVAPRPADGPGSGSSSATHCRRDLARGCLLFLLCEGRRATVRAPSAAVGVTRVGCREGPMRPANKGLNAPATVTP